MTAKVKSLPPTNFQQYVTDFTKYSRYEEIARKIPLLGIIFGAYFNYKKSAALNLLREGYSIYTKEFNALDAAVQSAAIDIIHGQPFARYEAHLKKKNTTSPAPLKEPRPKTVEGFERAIDKALIEVFGPRAAGENFREKELPIYLCLLETPDAEQAIPIMEKLYPGRKPIIDMKVDLTKALELKNKNQELVEVLSKMPEITQKEILGNHSLEKAVLNRLLQRIQNAPPELQAKAASFAVFCGYLPECWNRYEGRADKERGFRIAFEVSSLDGFSETVDLIMRELGKDSPGLVQKFTEFLEKKQAGEMTPQAFLKQFKQEPHRESPASISSNPISSSVSPSTAEEPSSESPPILERPKSATPPPIVAGLPPRSAKMAGAVMASPPDSQRQIASANQQTSHPALANLYIKIREILASVFGPKEREFYTGMFSAYLALAILLEDKNYDGESFAQTQSLLTEETGRLGWEAIDLNQVQELKKKLEFLFTAISTYNTEEIKKAIQGKHTTLEKAFSRRILESVGIERNGLAQEFYRKGRTMAQSINRPMNGQGNPLLLPLSSN